MNDKLIVASKEGGDADAIASLSKELDEAKVFSETGLDELLGLTEELEVKAAEYEARLRELD